MRLILAGNKNRGVACLRALVSAGHDIAAVITPPSSVDPRGEALGTAAQGYGIDVLAPVDVNAPSVVSTLAGLTPEVLVLAGYGQILREQLIRLPRYGCVNLHAGRLPQYRGSSPMNWALINGEQKVTVSVIAVNRGVDTGDILAEMTRSVGPDDTVADLQAWADATFPDLLVDVVAKMERGINGRRQQDESDAEYWPLRFPDDGLILFDTLSAVEIHNRIRALTDPYPGAFTYYRGRSVRLLASRLSEPPFHGEPGRIYRKSPDGLLVCALDRSLWITRAVMQDTHEDALDIISRYEMLATLRGAVASVLKES